MYSAADYLIRLPGDTPIPSFENQDCLSKKKYIFDVPLVVRLAQMPSPDVRLKYGILLSAKVLLISFGGHDIGAWDFEKLLPREWIALIVAPGQKTVQSDRLIIIPDGEVFVPDLVGACDIVLGKIGYGTCSEGKAFLLSFTNFYYKFIVF